MFVCSITFGGDQNKWKPEDIRSNEYGGYDKISKPNPSNLSHVQKCVQSGIVMMKELVLVIKKMLDASHWLPQGICSAGYSSHQNSWLCSLEEACKRKIPPNPTKLKV